MSDRPVLRSGPIRYATARRFEPPEPCTGDDPGRNTLCPQLPSRLDRVMGPPRDELPQDEDCLNLTVTSPGFDDGARPVLVWLHGGGFNSGGGLLEWYDGGRLAAEGDVVVVGVNYRLGALGYLHLPGTSPGNLGLLDQLEALRWVRRNIADLGGDPDNVTVFGQSAGALSAWLMLRLPSARGLFRRVILQSPPLGAGTRTAGSATEIGRRFVGFLGDDPRDADVADILAAQRATAAAGAKVHGTVRPSFTPVAEVFPLTTTSADTFGPEVDVLFGWNRDDMTAFPDEGPDFTTATEHWYTEPLREFGVSLAETGARVHGYRLDWRPEDSPFGATHCLELPLLLGTERAWRNSPMLGTVPWSRTEAFGAALRPAWCSFARSGTLDTASASGWPITWLDFSGH